MFKELRRKDRQIDFSECVRILNEGVYGILSTIGEDGYPYGVPVSYVYKDDSILFHCAVEGKKLENFKFNDKVSFCVVGETEVLSRKFSIAYESVIVFGRIKEIEGEQKEDALYELINKYSKDHIKEGIEYIKKDMHKTKVYKIEVEHISGKGRRC